MKHPVTELVNFYYELRGWDKYPKDFWKKTTDPKYSYARNMKEAKELLEYCEGDIGGAMRVIYEFNSKAKYNGMEWRLSTILK